MKTLIKVLKLCRHVKTNTNCCHFHCPHLPNPCHSIYNFTGNLIRPLKTSICTIYFRKFLTNTKYGAGWNDSPNMTT